MAGKDAYEALWPLARSTGQSVEMSARAPAPERGASASSGTTSSAATRCSTVLEAGLAERFPGSTFVPYTAFGNVHGHDEREVLEGLPDRLREEEVDAVIAGVGA